MRILQVCSATEIGGGELHVIDLVRALANRGHAVYMAVRPGSPLREPLSGVIAAWHEFPLRNSLDIVSSRGITDVINDNSVDITHAHVGRDYLVAALACKRTAAKLVLTRHHYLPLRQNAIYRWLLGDAARIIAVSSSVRQSVIERLAIAPDKVHIIPNWIDASRFNLIDREAARAMFQVRSSLAAACIGQITPAKGQEEFVRAAGRIARMRTDTDFLIVGEESEGGHTFTDQLRDLSRQLGIDDRVSFKGYVSHLPELLAAVDVVVVPSWDEGFSLVTIEALAARRAVLAADTGGIRDIIKDNSTGMLFQPRDVGGLANKLLWLLSDGPLRERLASQGQRDVYSRYSREKTIDMIEALYLDILES
jgi:glycosyltransferase involved in cell wall biosynthesis